MIKPCSAFLLLVSSFLLLTFSSESQQLKLGNHPTQIEKSAVLELESDRQGLLLTRVSDTSDETGIDKWSPPDGMIIYFTGSNAGVYQRRNGYWERIAQLFEVSSEPGPNEDIEFTRLGDVVTLHLPDAGENTRGVVNTDEQTFSGNKTFNDALSSEGLFHAASNAQIDGDLTLTSLPNTDPDKYLTTDETGKVILRSIDDVFWQLGGNAISTGTEGKLGTLSEKDLQIITNGEERIRISKDGNVGIKTSSPQTTLDVNGTFKLGADGSPFSAMAHAVTQPYKITVDNDYDVHIFNDAALDKIAPDAHIVVNPQQPLQEGGTIAMIAWARASGAGEVTICFHTLGTGDIGPITFDIYYINPGP